MKQTNNQSRAERVERMRRRRQLRQKISRDVIQAFVWIGLAVCYYLGFSLFFDTPTEYAARHSTDRLREEYEVLSARYDSLSKVIENVAQRDKNVFNIMFEADPYDMGEGHVSSWARYENLIDQPTDVLSRTFNQRVASMEKNIDALTTSYRNLLYKIHNTGNERNYIPAIQPVINDELTLLTASYGMRIHPFFKTLASHQGVDYTVPEGTRVFATADGRVSEVALRNSTSGQTLVIDHGNGYTTSYSHLSKVYVKRGATVRRGDIVALSGNTGLSLAPHLHYEVRYNGMRVDPIHYFFMELTPDQYYRIMQIAQSGMQSFD
ncbi:MAG: peptidoglycan DD-metalloendopeptidase family protein [Rikenellaceae bacterium]|nr:peptidoglycan DD-metalloendopeptidase family protein [Rikenellaceae bacterium]